MSAAVEMGSTWNLAHIPNPAFISKKFDRTQLTVFADGARVDKPETWVQELHNSLTRISRELNNDDVTRALRVESALLHAIVTQKTSIRSEKFYPKLKQLNRAIVKFLLFDSCKFLESVSLMTAPVKPAIYMQDHRLPNPPLLRHSLIQLARGHATLVQCVHHSEEAAVWLNCKMKLGQRAVLSLTLYAVAARLRALSLYLLTCMQTAYSRLHLLLGGVTGRDGLSILLGLPSLLHQDRPSTAKNAEEMEELDAENFLQNIFSKRKPHGSSNDESAATASTDDDDQKQILPATTKTSTAPVKDEDFGEVITRNSVVIAPMKKKSKLKKKFSIIKKPIEELEEKYSVTLAGTTNSRKRKREISDHSPSKKSKKKVNVSPNGNDDDDDEVSREFCSAINSYSKADDEEDETFKIFDKLQHKLNLKKKLKSINNEMEEFKENLETKKQTFKKSCSLVNLPQILPINKIRKLDISKVVMKKKKKNKVNTVTEA